MQSPLSQRALFNLIFLVLRTHWGCIFQLPLPSLELPGGLHHLFQLCYFFFLSNTSPGRMIRGPLAMPMMAQGSTQETRRPWGSKPALPAAYAALLGFLKDYVCQQETCRHCSRLSTRNLFLYSDKNLGRQPRAGEKAQPRLLPAFHSTISVCCSGPRCHKITAAPPTTTSDSEQGERRGRPQSPSTWNSSYRAVS